MRGQQHPSTPPTLPHRALATEHVDVHANAFNPVNYGTTTNPIGGLDLQVTMSSHGYFKKTVVGCHIMCARAPLAGAVGPSRDAMLFCRSHLRTVPPRPAAPAVTAAARWSPATRTSHLKLRRGHHCRLQYPGPIELALLSLRARRCPMASLQ